MLAQLMTRERAWWGSLVIVAVGCAVGLWLHPDFPDDLYLWWVQNVRVLTLKWTENENIYFGGELYPPQIAAFLNSATGVTLAFFLSYLMVVVSTRVRSTRTVTMFLVTAFFGLLTMLSARFMEYLAPFMIAYFAFLVADLLRGIDLSGLIKTHPERFWGASTIALAGCLGLVAHTYSVDRREKAEEKEFSFEVQGKWLRENAEADAIVFTGDWDDFPQIFFYNDKNRYLCSLDPAFFYEYDRELWKIWNQIKHGDAPDLYHPITMKFHAKYAFATRDHTTFLRKAHADPRFEEVARSEAAVLYRLLDDKYFISGVAVSGPYAIPRENYQDLDKEMLANLDFRDPIPTEDRKHTFKPWVPYPRKELGSFIDLAAMFDGAEDCTAYTSAQVDSSQDQKAELGVGFDDGIVIWVEGNKVFSNEGPSAASVDQVTVAVTLKKGINRILIRCDNLKKHWGFFLRFTELEGKALAMVPSDD